MSKNTTDEITYASVKAISGGDYSALTIRIGDKLFTFIGEESEAIEALISNREKLLLDRVEGLAELTESYRQGSRLACKNCGTETRGEFLVPAFQAIPLSTIQALRKELDGGSDE